MRLKPARGLDGDKDGLAGGMRLEGLWLGEAESSVWERDGDVLDLGGVRCLGPSARFEKPAWALALDGRPPPLLPFTASPASDEGKGTAVWGSLALEGDCDLWR